MTNQPTTTRVRIIESAWPERVGCEGDIVNDPCDGVYPFHKLGTEHVVVRLDNDPVGRFKKLADGRTWSCVYPITNIEILGETPNMTHTRKDKPCDGFAWIGQPILSCDECGWPAWDHDRRSQLADDAPLFSTDRWTNVPWEPKTIGQWLADGRIFSQRAVELLQVSEPVEPP